MSQIDPISVLIFGPIALLFAPFPLYPFHASQAGTQKTSQLCVFLLQVASLGDFSDVSDIILMPSSCIRPHFANILMFLTLLWLQFSLSDLFFSWFFWNCAPRLHGKHNSRYRHKAFLMKNLTFSTSKCPKSIPFRSWFSALLLCCSLLSPFIPSMPPKLDLKKRRNYVYYCYKWPAWATSTMYPSAFWCHLNISDTFLSIL